MTKSESIKWASIKEEVFNKWTVGCENWIKFCENFSKIIENFKKFFNCFWIFNEIEKIWSNFTIKATLSTTLKLHHINNSNSDDSHQPST